MNEIVQHSNAPAWDPNSGEQLPAYLSTALGGLGSNIPDRMTVPSLSYEGKTWTIVKDGNKTKLQAKNEDGDMVPVPIMRAVILNYNNNRGRSYYPGVYNPATSSAPLCWSADGVAPDASVKEKQSSTCASCPMSVKGSKVQDGKEMVACSSHRMIAIAPAFDIAADPLRLKIAVTSDYDKEIVDHGWFAFRQYADYLKSRGVTHTALVVTKIKFDANVAYPKLLFALDRVLAQGEVQQVEAAVANPKVADLLAEKWGAGGTAGTPTNDADIKPFGLEGAYADGWQAHPESSGYSWKGTEVLLNPDLAARYPEPKAPALPESAAPPIPATAPPIPASEMVIEQPAQPAKAPPVAEPAATPAVSGKPTNPDHIAHAGTTNELWWNGTAWMDPWDEVVTAAEAGFRDPNASAAAAKATAPQSTESVATAAAAESAAPSTPTTTHDAVKAAEADGWIAHPTAPGYHYKGEEVIPTGDLTARFPAPTAAPAAPAAAAPAAAPADSTNDAALAAVAGLLDKWAG